MSTDVETKLSAARTRLILDKPFLGALVLRLPMVAADPKWCKTTATDARKFYYNPRYIEGLSLDQTQFMLAHEALHCALSHFVRRQHRAKHRWDVACDLAINPLLIKDGLKPPPGALYMAEFDGMTAEEIYPAIDDLDEEPETRLRVIPSFSSTTTTPMPAVGAVAATAAAAKAGRAVTIRSPRSTPTWVARPSPSR